MGEAYFEQELRAVARFWIALAASVGLIAWFMWPRLTDPAMAGSFTWIDGFAIAVGLMPMAYFGLPALRHTPRTTRIDAEGVWRDGELLVAADEITHIAAHAHDPYAFRRTRTRRRRTGDGDTVEERVEEIRIAGVGRVDVPLSDSEPIAWAGAGWLPEAVVVFERETDDGERRRHAHLVHARRGERSRIQLIEALLRCAPAVDEPVQILRPRYQGTLMSVPRPGKSDYPPLPDWDWRRRPGEQGETRALDTSAE